MQVFEALCLPGSNSSVFYRFWHHLRVAGAPAFREGLWSQKSGGSWTLCWSAGGKGESHRGHLCHESDEEESLVGPGAGRSILESHPFPSLYQNVHCRDDNLLNWHLGSSTSSSVTQVNYSCIGRKVSHVLSSFSWTGLDSFWRLTSSPWFLYRVFIVVFYSEPTWPFN